MRRDLWMCSFACVVLWSCGGTNGNPNQDFPLEATVVNPPPLDPPILREFEPAFFGWRFGGGVSCNQDAMPVEIAIWEGITDPCTQIPDEDSRVVIMEISDITPGLYTIANGCLVPTDRISRVFFGVFRGQLLQLREAEAGQVTLQGLDDRDALQGVFSVRFQGEGSFTSGSFRLRAQCL